MAKMTATEFREKQARNLKNATADIRRGIESVTESPTKKAAAKADKYLAGIQTAVQTGKWQRGLDRVTLEEWKEKTLNLGVPRIAAGIDAAAPKVEAFAAELLPYTDRVQKEIAAMPDATIQDSIARATRTIELMAAFKRSK